MKKSFLLLLVVVYNISPSFADPGMRSRIKEASTEYPSHHFMNGVFIFTDQQGVIEKGAIGVKSVEQNTKLTPDQRMPIASATKTFTAVAILRLQERGLLNVQDSVAKHLNEQSGIWENNIVPYWAHEVTIHNMLTHSSGIADYFPVAKLDITTTHHDIIRQIAHFAASKNLSFTPGRKCEYNNTNYVILGLIIENVSGKKLEKFFRSEFFVPLGMQNTDLLSLDEALSHQRDPNSTDAPTRYFVTSVDGKVQFNPAKHSFTMIPFADGGGVSTTTDLAIWHRALHSGQILSDSSYKQMTTGYYNIPDKIGSNSKLGYGLHITHLENGDILYHHPGNAYAIRGEAGCVVTKGLCYAVLSNVMVNNPDDIQDKIDLNKSENQLDIVYFIKYVLKNI